tara:strand:+ start:637 stop:873 length:237 start_codon:yes stop_codon:yes gene_type:complete
MKETQQVVNDFENFDDMVTSVRKVLKSLINKDGRYKPAEAQEIHNGFGKQLNAIKMEMEAYKLAKITPNRKELLLISK